MISDTYAGEKYDLRWYSDPGQATSAAVPPRDGHTTVLLRLAPDGPYSTIEAPEPAKGSGGTLGVVYGGRGRPKKVVKFQRVEAGLYQLRGEPVTIEDGDAESQTEAS